MNYKLLVCLFCNCIILVALTIEIYREYKENKIKKYMLSKGWEYYIRAYSTIGNKKYRAYKKDGVSIDEEKLYDMSVKQIKEKY